MARLLASCDTGTGRRDLAILIMLARRRSAGAKGGMLWGRDQPGKFQGRVVI